MCRRGVFDIKLKQKIHPDIVCGADFCYRYKMLVFDIGFFQTEMFLFVHSLKCDTQQKGSHAKTSKHCKRNGVVKSIGSSTNRIGFIKHLTVKHRE